MIASPTVSQRLETVFNIALGAAVGFLPSAFLLLFHQKPSALSTETVLLLWALTTVIVIHEWWLSVDFLHDYAIDNKSGPFQLWSVIMNLAYVIILLSLPLSLVAQDLERTRLLWYGIGLLSLSLIDIPLTFPHWLANRSDRRLMTYMFYDVVPAALLYAGWILWARNQGDLLDISIALAVLYGIEMACYEFVHLVLLPHVIVSSTTSA